MSNKTLYKIDDLIKLRDKEKIQEFLTPLKLDQGEKNVERIILKLSEFERLVPEDMKLANTQIFREMIMTNIEGIGNKYPFLDSNKKYYIMSDCINSLRIYLSSVKPPVKDLNLDNEKSFEGEGRERREERGESYNGNPDSGRGYSGREGGREGGKEVERGYSENPDSGREGGRGYSGREGGRGYSGRESGRGYSGRESGRGYNGREGEDRGYNGREGEDRGYSGNPNSRREGDRGYNGNPNSRSGVEGRGYIERGYNGNPNSGREGGRGYSGRDDYENPNSKRDYSGRDYRGREDDRRDYDQSGRDYNDGNNIIIPRKGKVPFYVENLYSIEDKDEIQSACFSGTDIFIGLSNEIYSFSTTTGNFNRLPIISSESKILDFTICPYFEKTNFVYTIEKLENGEYYLYEKMSIVASIIASRGEDTSKIDGKICKLNVPIDTREISIAYGSLKIGKREVLYAFLEDNNMVIKTVNINTLEETFESKIEIESAETLSKFKYLSDNIYCISVKQSNGTNTLYEFNADDLSIKVIFSVHLGQKNKLIPGMYYESIKCQPEWLDIFIFSDINGNIYAYTDKKEVLNITQPDSFFMKRDENVLLFLSDNDKELYMITDKGINRISDTPILYKDEISDIFELGMERAEELMSEYRMLPNGFMTNPKVDIVYVSLRTKRVSKASTYDSWDGSDKMAEDAANFILSLSSNQNSFMGCRDSNTSQSVGYPVVKYSDYGVPFLVGAIGVSGDNIETNMEIAKIACKKFSPPNYKDINENR